MRKLLNSLYILEETAYLTLDGENIVCRAEDSEKFRVPFTNIEDIYIFSYSGCSPALMGKCAEYGIAVNFISPQGKFLARVQGKTKGNVYLRKEQFELFSIPQLDLIRNTVAALVFQTDAAVVILDFFHQIVHTLAVYLDAPARLIRDAGHHQLTVLCGDLAGDLPCAVVGDIPLVLLQGIDVLLEQIRMEGVEEKVLDDGVIVGNGHTNGDLCARLVFAKTQDGVIIALEVLAQTGTGGKGHCVLLGHAYIKEPLRVRVCKELQTSAVLHRCRDGADGFVRCSLLIQQVAEHSRERFLRGDLRVRDAVDEVELRDPMEVAGVALGGRVTLALFRDDMQEVRAGLLMDAAQDPLDFLLIVAVKGAVVMEAHILKHGGVVHGAASFLFPR